MDPRHDFSPLLMAYCFHWLVFFVIISFLFLQSIILAIERWKGVCWNPTSSHRNCAAYQPSTNRSSAVSSAGVTRMGPFGLASFKRRTTQLELFFIVTGVLMIVNTAHYLAAMNFKCDPYIEELRNFPEYRCDEKDMETKEHLALSFHKVWPFIRELMIVWLPAAILFILNVWIVIFTMKYLLFQPPFHLGRHLKFRRMTSCSISTQPNNNNNNTQTTNVSTTAPSTPTAAPNQPPQSPTVTTPTGHLTVRRNQYRAKKRRQLTFAWLTLLALPTIFITFMLPLSVLNIYKAVSDDYKSDDFDFEGFKRCQQVFLLLSHCNDAINCFIYCLTFAKFRVALCRPFKQIFGFFTGKKRSNNGEYLNLKVFFNANKFNLIFNF